MVAPVSQPTPDLREPLAWALSIRLRELGCRPKITSWICNWLIDLADAVEQIDGGQSFVIVLPPSAFLQRLLSWSEAQAIARANHPLPHGALGVDLRPILSWLRYGIVTKTTT